MSFYTDKYNADWDRQRETERITKSMERILLVFTYIFVFVTLAYCLNDFQEPSLQHYVMSITVILLTFLMMCPVFHFIKFIIESINEFWLWLKGY